MISTHPFSRRYLMSYEILKKHRQIWRKKKILQHIYHDWYALIKGNMVSAEPTLEIGGGGGHFKEYLPDLISSDYTYCPWQDLNLDAHALPFGSNTLGNIVIIDVLHHLTRPTIFIEEAQRVLQKNGRLIILEPYISPGSYLIYKYLHQEDVNFDPDVFSEEMWPTGDQKRPFDGNMAIPTKLFSRQSGMFAKQFPRFPVIKKSYSDYLIYPLSGGFEHPSLIPMFSLSFLKSFEKILQPIGFLFAYRMLVVLENRKE